LNSLNILSTFLEEPVMNRITVLATMLILILVAAVRGDEPTVAEVTNWQLQAVDEDGVGTYDATDKVIITGIVLNNPEEMLDPTPNAAGYMGGQWQMYIEGEGSDHAGTAVYMAQNYTMMGGGNYTADQWSSELWRVNHDPNTGWTFHIGDRVSVTGWYLFHNGKTNINTLHIANPFYDFNVALVTPAAGLPQPETITLNLVKDGSNQFIFDPTRLTGCEYYQARLVRVDDVNIIDPQDWAPNGTVTIMDSNGLTFPVLLGIGTGFTRYACPRGQISVIAIFDQESTDGTNTDGYRLWVTNYDGNGLVLTNLGYKRGNLPGDINGDYTVDFLDFAELASEWLIQVPGLYCCGE
jgi:hypothetical protein